ncbi:MAG: hypothetical protein V3U92_11860 [Cellulophaga sp.]
MKNSSIIYLVLICLLSIQCQKKDNPFLITKDSIGLLNKESLVSELNSIYAQDSISRDTLSRQVINTKKIQIYEKGGKHLLSLTPSLDSIQKIENIRIYDSRFVTEKGVGISSTFKDIKANYTIKKIVTSLNNIVILLKDSDFYFTIDKKELPANLRYTSNTTIEEVQIPDTAKIKYFMIGW